ncbi:MAG: 2-amino-4-hydroxy-6-hydroxymethyldihydropteridine diphosphokinase [Bacteroidales bacterium]|nr:2-amino-4-hydroxy-6-hydroxymethyldihydropteridine diphosphokinase [Bacteroidales bacterium]
MENGLRHTAVLLLGGNEGDRYARLAQARELIGQRIGEVEAASAVRETEPWGDFGATQPQAFLNQALVVATDLEAHEVLREALAIEAELGRRRSTANHYSSRPMDIDIIFFDNAVIDQPSLQIPHPRMHLRRFVLEPLAELMPSFCHPTLGRTMAALLRSLPADSK